MSLNLRAALAPVPRRARFALPHHHVWCGTVARTADGYHLLFSRWPKTAGFHAWVTHSEVAWASADNPLGPYVFRDVVLPGRPGAWDEVVHNPTVIAHQGHYYLYYMGTRGPGGWWDYRNRQRIGVAVAEHPAGPWQRFDTPLLDVTPDTWDGLMTSNPSVTAGPDGRFYMMYKGVGEGPLPKGGKVLAGMAVAAQPLGPFVKTGVPTITDPDHDWAVEDAFIWHRQDHFYCLIKDFHGTFCGQPFGLALFWSQDGFDWHLSGHPLGVPREICWDDGQVETVHRLERPQLWLEGDAGVLCCACLPREGADTFNVQMPLRFADTPMA